MVAHGGGDRRALEGLRVESLGRAPRVLVSGVVLDQPMGGVWRHNEELLPRVADLLAAAGGGLSLLVGRGGLARALPSVRRLTCDVPSRPLALRPFREARALNAALREAAGRGAPFDLVHVGHLPAPRGLTVPRTQTIHDLRSVDLPEHTPFSRRLVAKSVVGRALEGAAGVFTVSEHVAGRLRAGWPGVAGKLAVIPNAGDHLRALPRSPGPQAPILHVGHVEPRKNLGLVVRALAAAPDLPDLVLAGSAKGDEAERLRTRARGLGIEDRVRFEGAFDDAELPELLATCAAVVLPSRLEGFGIVALEAVGAGCPLALSDIGPHREVVPEGGAWFDPDDLDGCVAALRAACGGQAPPAPVRHRWGDSAERLARGWAAALERCAGRSA